MTDVRPPPARLAGQPASIAPAPDSNERRRALSGFFFSGILFSFLGAILPSWGYHLRSDFTGIGFYFLAMNVGIWVSARVAYLLIPRHGVRAVFLVASSSACAAFLALAWMPVSATNWGRTAALFMLGFAGGLLNASVLHAMTPLYELDRAATVNLAGILFGSGCLLTALFVSGTFYVYTTASVLVLFAAIAALFAVWYGRSSFDHIPLPAGASWAEALHVFQNPAAILFTLFLFFQFGNEWSLAGWLALFLIRRLGISPEASLMLLALFWAVLLFGRIIGQVLLNRIRHSVLLIVSALSALLGCLILASTTNRFGAVMGILFVSAGFATIYPVVVEAIAGRFVHYHPGFYNTIFSIGFTGGLLAPWTLGYLADAWGIQAVILVPLGGTCIVFVLLLLILLEAKLSGLERAKGAGA